MAQQVAVDVGYGYTKALSDAGGRCCFPSVLAPVHGSAELAGALGGEAPRHRVSIQRPGGGEELWAGRAGLAAGGRRSWNTGAASRPDYDALILAAVALVGAEGLVDLTAGLPVSVWQQPAERRALRERLRGLGAWVSADGGEARYVEVAACRVLPQALGAYVAALHAEPALSRGSYGICDIGWRTTDLALLLPDEEGFPVPDDLRSGSVDVGVGLAYDAVRQALERETGALVDEAVVLEALERDGRLKVRGAEHDLRGPFAEALATVAERVEAATRRLWSDRLEFLDALLVAGGGGVALLPFLHLPGARPVPGGVFANAEGFLRHALDQAPAR